MRHPTGDAFRHAAQQQNHAGLKQATPAQRSRRAGTCRGVDGVEGDKQVGGARRQRLQAVGPVRHAHRGPAGRGAPAGDQQGARQTRQRQVASTACTIPLLLYAKAHPATHPPKHPLNPSPSQPAAGHPRPRCHPLPAPRSRVPLLPAAPQEVPGGPGLPAARHQRRVCVQPHVVVGVRDGAQHLQQALQRRERFWWMWG